MHLKRILLGLFCLVNLSGWSQEAIVRKVEKTLEKSTQLWTEDAYVEALQLLELCFEQNKIALGKNPLIKAALLQERGWVYFLIDEEHYQESIQDYEAALALRTSVLAAHDSIIIQTHYLMARTYEADSQFKNGIACLKDAIQKFSKNPNHYVEIRAKLYLLLGSQYLDIKDLGNAQEYTQQALQLYQQLNREDQVLECYGVLAVTLSDMGKYEKAIDYYQKIIDHNKVDQENIANTYNNIGRTYLAMNQASLAKDNFERSEQLNRKLDQQHPSTSLKLNIARNLENMGVCFRRLGQYEAAIRSTKAAMKIMKNLNMKFHSEIAQCHENMGDILQEQKKYEAAVKAYHQGMLGLLPRFKSEDVFSNPSLSRIECQDNPTLLKLLALKARSFKLLYEKDITKTNYLEAAYQSYLCFDSLLVEIRQGFRITTSVYTLLKNNHDSYEDAIDVAIQMYRNTGEVKYYEIAYHFAAKNKAIVLLDGLQNEQAKFAGLPSAIQQKEQALKKQFTELEMAIYEQQLQADQKEKDLRKLQQERFDLKFAYEELLDQLERDYPQYYQLKYAFSEVSRIADFQNKLPEDGLLLEYFVGKKKLLTFAITKKDFKFYELEKPLGFEEKCKNFRAMISDITKDNDPDLAYDLFQTLLEKPLNELNQNQKINRLSIIPDDVLLQISFNTLLTKKTAVWENIENPYLLKKYAISYAYSNQLLFDEQKKEAIRSKLELFGGFGLEYADSLTLESLRLAKQNSKKEKRSLGTLLNVSEEVTEISELFDGKYWLNEEVNKQHFLEHAPRFKIVHWAGHGWAQENDPMNSALIFSLNPNVKDSLLRASELYSLKLNADMVVLSACNTGYGKLFKGEGMSSLARAFAYAGCPSIVSSLWDASDLSTKEILIDFYKNIKQKEHKDIALQKAMLTYINNNNPRNANPALWSNIIVIGDSSALDLEKSFALNWNFLWIGLLVLSLLFVWRIYSARTT